MAKHITRRRFLQSAASAGMAVGLPWIISPRSLGGCAGGSPSDRISLGFIGVGRQGTANLKALSEFPFVDIVAVCDVDASHLEAAQTVARKKTPGCAAYRDYRRLLDDSSVDAVVVSTPDH